MQNRRTITFILTTITVSILTATSLRAAPVEFTIDETRSIITLSGIVSNSPLQEQGPGSTNGTFAGKLVAEFGPGTIRFPGGSVIDAKTNGLWLPPLAGSSDPAPADFAAQATILFQVAKGALRNLLLDLTSSALPLSDGQFNGAALIFAFPTNAISTFDYSAGFLGKSSIALTGLSTNQIVNGGTLTTTADTQTLSIQLDTEFQFSSVVSGSVRFKGSLVATRSIPPSISSINVSKNGVVTLRVEGTGPAPTLVSSTDLIHWNPQTPTQTTDANGITLSLPASGPIQIYSVAK